MVGAALMMEALGTSNKDFANGMLQQLLKAGWFLRRPRTFGAHALALTPERKLILVKLRYARHVVTASSGTGRRA